MAEAARQVGMRRDELEVEAGEPPEEPPPDDEPPAPPSEQELEDQQGHGRVPPSGQGEGSSGPRAGRAPGGDLAAQIDAEAGADGNREAEDRDLHHQRVPEPGRGADGRLERREVGSADEARFHDLVHEVPEPRIDPGLGGEEKGNREQEPHVRADALEERHRHVAVQSDALNHREDEERPPGQQGQRQTGPQETQGADEAQRDRGPVEGATLDQREIGGGSRCHVPGPCPAD